MESDPSVALSWMTKRGEPLWKFSCILKVIEELSKDLKADLIHTYRGKNGAADYLPKEDMTRDSMY